MKSEGFLLWFIALLVAIQCFITLETFPEFYVPSQSKMQELVSTLSGDSQGVVQRELVAARWSGVNGQYLAKCILGLDAVLFIIVGSLIVNCYRRHKHVG